MVLLREVRRHHWIRLMLQAEEGAGSDLSKQGVEPQDERAPAGLAQTRGNLGLKDAVVEWRQGGGSGSEELLSNNAHGNHLNLSVESINIFFSQQISE